MAGSSRWLAAVALTTATAMVGACASEPDDTVDAGPPAGQAPPAEPSTTDTTSVATAEDEELIQSFLRFAAHPDPGSAALVPFAEEVALGLGGALQVSRTRAELGDAGAWSIELAGEELFRAHTGPFSALELAAAARDAVISVGPHAHCASPPMPAPAELTGLRRVSVQPSPGSIDSCLSWWTVDLFVTQQGHVAAVTLDVWEP